MRSPLQTRSAVAWAGCLIAAFALIAGCRRQQPATPSTTATPENAAANIQKIQSMLQSSSAAQSAVTADAAAEGLVRQCGPEHPGRARLWRR